MVGQWTIHDQLGVHQTQVDSVTTEHSGENKHVHDDEYKVVMCDSTAQAIANDYVSLC